MEYIELLYISPVSKYRFSNNIKYTLVFTNTIGNKVYIHKIPLKNINNVTNQNRAYSVHKTLKIPANSNIIVNLFEYNKNSNKMKLLFRGNMNMSKYELHNKSYVTMRPLYMLNKTSSLDSTFYIKEQFYNFIHRKSLDGYCLLFFKKLDEYGKAKSPIVKFSSVDTMTPGILVYDKYNNTIIKENIPDQVSQTGSLQKIHYNHTNYYLSYCNNNNNKPVNMGYQIDISQYNPQTKSIYSDFRPLGHDPYKNNLITSPVDSRIRGFNINPTLKLSIYDSIVSLYDLRIDPNVFKSGFYCRVCPQDYKGICFPYSGNVTKVTLNKLKRKLI